MKNRRKRCEHSRTYAVTWGDVVLHHCCEDCGRKLSAKTCRCVGHPDRKERKRRRG
jgi:hypothetical protein